MDYDGYLTRSTRRPGVMTGVIAIHAAGLTALLLLAPQVERAVETVMIGRTIPVPDDPKPILPDTRPPPAMAKAKLTLPPVDLKIDVRRAVDDTPIALAGDPGPIETGGGTGGGSSQTLVIPKDPVLTDPVMTSASAQPPYPSDMQRLEIEGKAVVRVLVGIDGRPVRIEAVRADRPQFFEATQRWGMTHWRFTPAMRDGVPVEAWRTLTVRFTLDS